MAQTNTLSISKWCGIAGSALFLTAFFFSQLVPSMSRAGSGDDFAHALSQAALERTDHTVRYDGAYRKIAYPNGDVPAEVGVCTDVVIRSYRALGIDLQKRVHEDMKAHFALYPNKWGLERTDTNIDHRRVPNLRVFFSRKGKKLKVSRNPSNYKAGDLVTWKLNNNLPHIGIVVNRRSQDGDRLLIVHNIGEGPKLEDVLFEFKITGHYRYTGNWTPQKPR